MNGLDYRIVREEIAIKRREEELKTALSVCKSFGWTKSDSVMALERAIRSRKRRLNTLLKEKQKQ